MDAPLRETLTVGVRREVRSLTVVTPTPAQALPEAWREGTVAPTSDAVLLCSGPLMLADADRQRLLAASAQTDAVLATCRLGGTAILVRSSDLSDLMLLRNRGRGQAAVRNAVSRLRQAGRTVGRLVLSGTFEANAVAGDNWLAETGRRLAEQPGNVGFAGGVWSRSHRNLEVWRSRRAIPVADTRARCPLCGAAADAQLELRLQTSVDLQELGDYSAVLCTQCAVGRTHPAPRQDVRVISPDLGDAALGAPQRALMRRFINQRVARVRPLLAAAHRPRVADVGGGACAFANALAATGCDVTVFEPNPANSRFADGAAGVRFVAAPFDEQSVAATGIADGTLDGITMWHSLEHVPDPAATLGLARRLLRRGGVLYVCVPNLDSMQSDVGGKYWCYADIPHHVTHFSPEGLESAMRRAGFATIAPHWWNAEYEVFGWYQTLLNRLTRSHNFFYNRAKKGRLAHAGPHPAWTRVATALGPLLLPAALLASWWEAAASKPACAELHGVVS